MAIRQHRLGHKRRGDPGFVDRVARGAGGERRIQGIRAGVNNRIQRMRQAASEVPGDTTARRDAIDRGIQARLSRMNEEPNRGARESVNALGRRQYQAGFSRRVQTNPNS